MTAKDTDTGKKKKKKIFPSFLSSYMLSCDLKKVLCENSRGHLFKEEFVELFVLFSSLWAGVKWDGFSLSYCIPETDFGKGQKLSRKEEVICKRGKPPKQLVHLSKLALDAVFSHFQFVILNQTFLNGLQKIF